MKELLDRLKKLVEKEITEMEKRFSVNPKALKDIAETLEIINDIEKDSVDVSIVNFINSDEKDEYEEL